MRVLWWINRILLTLLAVSTGGVKLAQMAEEMEIFWAAGFPTPAIIAFGVVQLVAGLALLHPRSLRIGAAVLIVTFVIATGVLFINGLIPFGVFSLLFIAMAAWPALQPAGPGAAATQAAAA